MSATMTLAGDKNAFRAHETLVNIGAVKLKYDISQFKSQLVQPGCPV